MHESLRSLKIENMPIAQLRPHRGNPRAHSAKQVRQIAGSIREFGFNTPILIDQKDGVIAGHGRILAAKLLGMSEVPTIRLDQMTEAQKRAYIIAARFRSRARSSIGVGSRHTTRSHRYSPATRLFRVGIQRIRQRN